MAFPWHARHAGQAVRNVTAAARSDNASALRDCSFAMAAERDSSLDVGGFERAGYTRLLPMAHRR
jgi:hypothetical protein